MTQKRTTLFENSLIWFGAAISISEIMTGTYFADLGFGKGLAAVFLGHLIGGVLLFLSGLIGGKTRKSAMETVKRDFGSKGGLFFAGMNIIQLVGWTAIMIYDGAEAASGLFNSPAWVWCMVIGGLILLWIALGIQNLGKINTVAMAALFVLTFILCKVIFFDGTLQTEGTGQFLSFGAAVELAAAMPLSWLPLIGDYTAEAGKPVLATAVSTLVYSLVSCWMYVIGMGAALFTDESDVAAILLKAGLGAAGLVIVVFSTVTTTFLDAWSAGISAESLFKKVKGKYPALVTALLGTAGALLFPMDDITDFLYLIGSVFAPMAAVQITDFFVLHRSCEQKTVDVRNSVIWLAGFVTYRRMMGLDLPCGTTLPAMVITGLLCIGAHFLFDRKKDSSR